MYNYELNLVTLAVGMSSEIRKEWKDIFLYVGEKSLSTNNFISNKIVNQK